MIKNYITMSPYTPKVIKNVVNQNMCVGCGACTSACNSNAIEMNWNSEGFLIPKEINICNGEGACIKVCPFNPTPSDICKDEDVIAKKYLTNQNFNDRFGYYKNIYAGYSHKYRKDSSSGGIATYTLVTLLEKKIVDYVICVTNVSRDNEHFSYEIFNSVSKIEDSAKTKYYPVTYGKLLEKIESMEGKFAITGIPCFIKAIRLSQINNEILNDKITFTIGIICGGLKSRFYTEYMVSKSGGTPLDYQNVEYRIKDIKGKARDYSFQCDSKNRRLAKLSRWDVIDMWGTGLFKAKACDFCDDTSAELADLSLGDAWMEPYLRDGKGHNVVISRSELADSILSEGAQFAKVKIDEIEVNDFLKSQSSSFIHRQDALPFRMKFFKHKILKRERKSKINTSSKLVQVFRMIVRKKSISIWKKYPNSVIFDKRLKKYLIPLTLATRLVHYQRRLSRNKSN